VVKQRLKPTLVVIITVVRGALVVKQRLKPALDIVIKHVLFQDFPKMSSSL
jgi:hypothetical protein